MDQKNEKRNNSLGSVCCTSG